MFWNVFGFFFKLKFNNHYYYYYYYYGCIFLSPSTTYLYKTIQLTKVAIIVESKRPGRTIDNEKEQAQEQPCVNVAAAAGGVLAVVLVLAVWLWCGGKYRWRHARCHGQHHYRQSTTVDRHFNHCCCCCFCCFCCFCFCCCWFDMDVDIEEGVVLGLLDGRKLFSLFLPSEIQTVVKSHENQQ